MAIREDVARSISREVQAAILAGMGSGATLSEVMQGLAQVLGLLMSAASPAVVSAWLRREADRIDALALAEAVDRGELATRQ